MCSNLSLKLFALFISGFLVSMGFPSTTFLNQGLGIVLPFALIPLFYILNKKNLLTACGYLWFFGFVVQLFAFFWISQPIIYFSNLTPALAYPLYIFISALTALYFPFLFSPLLFEKWYLKRHPNKKIPIAILALAMVLLEILLPRFFNWSFGSLMSSELYINQLASIFGFNGISFLIFFTNLSLARMINSTPRSFTPFRMTVFTLGTNALLWGAVLIFGFFRVEYMQKLLVNLPTTRVAYVQPNFTFNSYASLPLPTKNSQNQSLDTLFNMSMQAIQKSLAKDGKYPDLLVWPESAAPNLFLFTPKDVLVTKNFVAKIKVPLLIQTIKWDLADLKKMGFEHAPLWSISFVIYPDGRKGPDFEKWVPMPFGESVPLEGTFPILGKIYRQIFQNASKVEIGKSYDALAYTQNNFVAPLICFDSIFPTLPRLEALKGKASIFVNQGNFVWMVKSNAGFEFSIVDQFRAIENARSLLFVTNTGPTMAFDPLGRIILKPTELLTQSFGFIDLPVYQGTTFYSRFSTWPILILGFISILLWFLL